MKQNYLPGPKIRVEGIVPLEQGGTNASTIEQAKINLKIIDRDTIGIPGGPIPLDPITGLIPLSYFQNIVASTVELDGPKFQEVDSTVQYKITNRDSRTSYSVSATVGTVSLLNDVVTYKTPVRYVANAGFTVNGTYFPVNLLAVVRIPNTPAITSPTSNLTENRTSMSFVSSAWSSNYPEDSLDLIEWEVAGNQSFTAPAPAGLVLTKNGLILTVSEIPPDALFYVRMRHLGYYGYYSAYSNVRWFQRPAERKPGKPMITDPSANGVIHESQPLVKSSAFVPGEVGDTHASSDWQISTSSDFTTGVQTFSGSGSLLLEFLPSLTRDTGYYLRVRHTSAAGWTSDWSDTRQLMYVPVEPPVRPTITSPSMNVVINVATVTIESSAFTATAPGDTLATAEWQRSTDPTFATNLFTASFDINQAYNSWYNSTLAPGNVYYFRVRYRGSSGWYSDWSLVRTVTYAAVLKPSILYPAANAERIAKDVTIVSSQMLTVGISTTHAYSDWQVGQDVNFAYVVKSSIDSAAAKTEWPIQDLEYGRTYFVRVRHKAANGYISAWSDPVQFKTKAALWDPLQIADLPISQANFTSQDRYFETGALSVSNNGRFFAILNHVYWLQSAGPVLIQSLKKEDLFPGIAGMSIMPSTESISITVNTTGTKVIAAYAADVSLSGTSNPKFLLSYTEFNIAGDDSTGYSLVQDIHYVVGNPKAQRTDGTDVNEFYLAGPQNYDNHTNRVVNFSEYFSGSANYNRHHAKYEVVSVPNFLPDPQVDTYAIEEHPVDPNANVTVRLTHVDASLATSDRRHYMEDGFFAYADGVDVNLIKFYAATDTNALSPKVMVAAAALTNPGTVTRPVNWKLTGQWMKADLSLFMTAQNSRLLIYTN